MSTATLPTPPTVKTAKAKQAKPATSPRRVAARTWFRLTVDQFHTMRDASVFELDPLGDHVELIDGRLTYAIRGDSLEDPVQMKPSHATPIRKLTRLAPRFDGHGCFLQVQVPVTLPEFNEPTPDGAVVRGVEDDFGGRHPGPGDILCLIEVADASIARDRGRKRRAYATANVPLYVILHVPRRTAEVHSDPRPGDGRYGRVETLAADATLRLPTATDHVVEVAVGDLLPEPATPK